VLKGNIISTKVEEMDKVFSFGEGKPYPTKKTLGEKAAQ